MSYFSKIDSDGFFVGAIHADSAPANHPTVVNIAPPEGELPQRQVWRLEAGAWVARENNAGTTWYNPDDTDIEFKAQAWDDQPPTGYVHWANGQNKVVALPEQLRKAKNTKWATIKQARSAAEYAGFTWDGSTFDSDATSQNRITGAVTLAQMSSDFTIDWILADNTTRTLSSTDMMQVGAALGAHVAAQFANGVLLRAQIDAATTKEAVEAVVWSQAIP